jgi:prepilin-type N-terminal cleavage/methylation domain-containing protein
MTNIRRILGRRNRKGFTLVELAITLVVLGLLTAAVMPALGILVKRKKENETQKQMEQIKDVLISYYERKLSLPDPLHDGDAPPSYRDFTLPIDALDLPPSAKKDRLYVSNYYAYVMTDRGTPFDDLVVNGFSLGNTAAVIISRGPNLTFDGENEDLTDGEFEESGEDGFDDLLIYVSEGELKAATRWMAEIVEDISVLDQSARVLAENDDDVDGYVDEGAPEDPPGNWDGLTDWSRVDASGVSSLSWAGLISLPKHMVDPWGTRYFWNASEHNFYSGGPDGEDDGGGGDDIVP